MGVAHNESWEGGGTCPQCPPPPSSYTYVKGPYSPVFVWLLDPDMMRCWSVLLCLSYGTNTHHQVVQLRPPPNIPQGDSLLSDEVWEVGVYLNDHKVQTAAVAELHCCHEYGNHASSNSVVDRVSDQQMETSDEMTGCPGWHYSVPELGTEHIS